ncbi:RNase P and RNase MRP subunit [Microbotryomycetes sp. JL221]|nr:RNase P and RNase MRP subunit [Microbotryomycetes sp. JL221]
MSQARQAQQDTSVRSKSKVQPVSKPKQVKKNKPQPQQQQHPGPSTSTGDRRTVYKPVLDHPLQVAWPPLPAAARQQIFDRLIELINKQDDDTTIAEWREKQHKAQKKAASAAKNHKRSRTLAGTSDDPSNKRRKLEPNSNGSSKTPKALTKSNVAPRPSILDKMTIGINETTRALETMVRLGRWQLGETSAPSEELHELRKLETEFSINRVSKNRLHARPDFDRLPMKTRRRLRHQIPVEKAPWKPDATEGGDIPYTGTARGRITLVPNSLELARVFPEAEWTDNPETPEDAKTFAFDESSVEWSTQIDLLFVCKPDINPPTLVAHLPTAAAAVNGVRVALNAREGRSGSTDAKGIDGSVDDTDDLDGLDGPRPPMYLVPLDIGAERKLSDALGLRRVAVIGLSCRLAGVEPLMNAIKEHVNPVTASWLVPFLANAPAKHSSDPQESKTVPNIAPTLIPTHIKHLKTTAPHDPKAAHAAKKERKKLIKQGVHIAED